MKTLNKLFYFISFITLVFTLSACGGITIDPEADIRKACKDGDFEKAHDILDNIDNSWTRRDCAKVLYSSEIEYLIAQNDNNSSDRVIFLLKETKKDDYYSELEGELASQALDLANDQNNIYLIKKILGLTTVWNKNIIIKLVKNSNDESREVIMNLLTKLGDFDVPSIGCGLDQYGGDWGGREKEEISEYNSKCNFVLDQAIFYKDKGLAQNVINVIKPNLDMRVCTVASYSYTDKETAQKKLDDAIKSGAFAE